MFGCDPADGGSVICDALRGPHIGVVESAAVEVDQGDAREGGSVTAWTDADHLAVYADVFARDDVGLDRGGSGRVVGIGVDEEADVVCLGDGFGGFGDGGGRVGSVRGPEGQMGCQAGLGSGGLGLGCAHCAVAVLLRFGILGGLGGCWGRGLRRGLSLDCLLIRLRLPAFPPLLLGNRPRVIGQVAVGLDGFALLVEGGLGWLGLDLGLEFLPVRRQFRCHRDEEDAQVDWEYDYRLIVKQ